MERYAETALALILSIFLSFGYTGAQSILLTHGSAQVKKSLMFTCSLNPSGSYSLFSVNWKLANYTNAIQRDPANCDSIFLPPEYEISRYKFTCSQSIFTMTINQLQQSDVHTCWTCSVVFANGTQIDGTRCIILDDDSQTTQTTKFDVTSLMHNLDHKTEGLTENEKIGIGAGCGGGGVIVIVCVAVIIYRRKINSPTSSNTLDHLNSSVEERRL